MQRGRISVCVILGAGLLGGCAPAPPVAQEAVDLLLHNGIVLTLDSAATQGTALAVRGDRIIAVGDERLLQVYQPARREDLQGRTVLPGLIDTHLLLGDPVRPLELTPAAPGAGIDDRTAQPEGPAIAELRALFRHGITSIVPTAESLEDFAAWEALYATQRGNLPRASVQVPWAGRDAMAAFGRLTGSGDEHLRLGAIQLSVDIGAPERAAFGRESDRGQADEPGVLNLAPEQIYQVIRDAHRAGWQLGIQPLDSAAIELTVEALASVLVETPRADHRHYLNHFTRLPSTETLAQMVANGIAITQQASFTHTLPDSDGSDPDDDRVARSNPLRTPMNHGIQVALSSGIHPVDPWVGLHVAVTRSDMRGREYQPAERITLLEALRGYTIGGAWLTREETLKGTLEAGKLADFIILSHNPLDVAEPVTAGLQVLETWLGGRQVYVHTEQGDPS